MRIAVVGGGATGALACPALGKHAADIVVIEPAEEIGRGLAYVTTDPRHLLNVRVANMSAFADRPNHLLDWLRSRGTRSGVAATTPFCFIPRGIYGAYLADLVRELRAGGALRHLRDRFVDLVEKVNDVVLTLESGDGLILEFVV